MIDLQVTPTKHGYDRITINGEEAIRLTSPKNSPTGESGGVRSVYLTSEYVYKYGSVAEAQLFIEEQDRKYFAPVILADINRTWVVQKRIDCIPNLATPEHWEEIQAIRDKYNIDDVSYKDDGTWGTLVERNTHNWIVDKNGIPVIFDYQFFW
jgi:hypothetical protein